MAQLNKWEYLAKKKLNKWEKGKFEDDEASIV